MIDGFTVNDRQGVQALDYNQRVHAAEGFGTTEGCDVTIDSGALGAGDTLTVSAGTIMFDGTEVSVPAQQAPIGAADQFPRRDVVYVDSAGDVYVNTGDPEVADPSQSEGVMAERPAPDAFADLEGTGVPIAEVWVPAGADVLESENVYSRTVPPIDARIDLTGFDEIVASEHGYPGDRSGGDVMQLIRDHPDKVIVLDGAEYSVETSLDYDGTDARSLLAVHGRGAERARLVVEEPSVDYFAQLDTWDAPNPFPNLSLKNLDLVVNDAANYPASDIDAGWGQWWIGERVDNENLRIVGQRNYGDGTNDGNKYGYHCCMANEEAVGVHREIKLPDGDALFDSQGEKDAAIGFSVEPSHVGTNIFIGCYAEEWWDNGFYVKDGTGRSILIGCEAYNCGNSHIRIGKHDQVLNCRARHDFDHSTTNATAIDGGLLECDEAEGTAVLGFRAIRKTGTSPAVRIRTGAESGTFRDLYIENETSQESIQVTQATAANSSMVDDNTHHDGIITIDGARIYDNGGTSVAGAAIRTRRSHCRLRDISTTLTTSGWRTSVKVEHGSAQIEGCRFESPGPPYEVEVGDSGSSQTVDVVSVTNSRFLAGGFILRDGTTIGALDIRGNDMRQIASGDLFYDLEPAYFGADCNFHGNLGHLGETRYGTFASATVSADSVSANAIDVANSITEGGDNVVTGDADRKIFVSSTQPSSATSNDLWFEPQ